MIPSPSSEVLIKDLKNVFPSEAFRNPPVPHLHPLNRRPDVLRYKSDLRKAL
jgi:hypothetical protein